MKNILIDKMIVIDSIAETSEPPNPGPFHRTLFRVFFLYLKHKVKNQKKTTKQKTVSSILFSLDLHEQ